jgi:L-rhamnose mutarotase
MITTIITALVSVFITVVVGYFIWSGISARKLKKQVKDNTKCLETLETGIKNLNIYVDEKVDEIYSNMTISQNDINKMIEQDRDDSYHEREKIYEEIMKRDNEHGLYDQELHRELDKRFDNVYKAITSNLSEKK